MKILLKYSQTQKYIFLGQKDGPSNYQFFPQCMGLFENFLDQQQRLQARYQWECRTEEPPWNLKNFRPLCKKFCLPKLFAVASCQSGHVEFTLAAAILVSCNETAEKKTTFGV